MPPTTPQPGPHNAAATPVAANVPGGPGSKAADGPGRPGPMVVNMPEARVDDATAPQPAQDGGDLRLPHERDQSGVDSTAAAPAEVMVQAAKDLASGQVDTDLRNQAGLDAGQRDRLLGQQP